MSDLLIKMPLDFEPLRKNRWLFRFPADLGIQEWWLTSGKRPSIKQGDTIIPFLNTQTHVVGKYSWDPIQISFRDPIGPSASQALMEWIRLHSESSSVPPDDEIDKYRCSHKSSENSHGKDIWSNNKPCDGIRGKKQDSSHYTGTRY